MCSTIYKSAKCIVAICVLSIMSVSQSFAQSLTKPIDHFGFQPGADRMLFGYEKMIDYFKVIEKQSPRVKTFNIGTTAMGRPLFLVCISSQENIANIEALKDINKSLALDYNLSKQQVDELKAKGKVFVMGTLSMHSSEVAPAQASPVIAYQLAKAKGADTISWLNNVVYMMVPCHNPDGMNMVIENYMQNKGTKNEGTTLPGVYHKYVGHNINRDFILLTQPENKAISALTSTEWFPQVMVEKHQMGSTGVRYFVPPNHDPIAQNVDETLWSWIGIFGANMLNDMTAIGQTGIAQRYIFDNYWPGSTETCLWKNVISFLTESASVKTATPIFIEKNELKVGGKGLSEYKKGANLIAPWEGGWWRLGDLVAYEQSSTFSMIKTASINREAILQYRNDITKKEYLKGLNSPPYYFVLPYKQNNKSELARLVDLLKEHGVNVSQLNTDITIDSRVFSKNDIVVSLAQPFRAFIKEVLEIQTYPERRYEPRGVIIKPYDITSWSLPFTMGLQCFEINSKSIDLEKSIASIENLRYINSTSFADYMVFNVQNNESFLVAFSVLAGKGKVFRTTEEIDLSNEKIPTGSFVVPSQHKTLVDQLKLSVDPTFTSSIDLGKLKELKMPTIGLVESYFQDMDAGWTRFLFDTYKIPYKVIRPSDLADPKIFKNYQIIIFPNHSAELLTSGKRKRENDYIPMNLAPVFTKGMGKKGKEQLMKFVDNGGILLSWGQSTDLFLGMQEIEIDKDTKEEFVFPVQNVAKSLAQNGLEAISNHVYVVCTQNHSLTLGMPKQFPIFFTGDQIFETSIPNFDIDRRVILAFPEGNPKVSGYLKNGELLEHKAAMVWIKKNKGQIILYGFNPQFRGQTSGTFKLLFNALFLE
jgi:hypothetical protein